MSEAHRVVVTGMGALSPLGRGVDALWSGLLAGRSGIRRLEGLDLTGQEVDFGGQVPNFDPSDILEAKQIKRLDRFAHFAIAASVEALSAAGLPARLSDAQALGTATIIGSGSAAPPRSLSRRSATRQRGRDASRHSWFQALLGIWRRVRLRFTSTHRAHHSVQ